MSYKKKTVLVLAAFAALRIIYLLYTPFDLSPDEAHYWEWSRRLDFSYYSKGPGVAYVIAFFTGIFGDSAFGVRVGAVVFSTLASYVIFLLGRDLFKCEKTGFYAAILANIVPVFSIGAILMTTDVLLVFFWGATLLCVKRALDGKGGWWWHMAGVFTGLGFLSKYTIALLYPCILLFLLASGKERAWLKRAGPYIGAVIGVALSSPVIYWNIMHGQVTIKHTLGQAHALAGGVSFLEPLEFLASQSGIITPVVFIGFIYGIYLCALNGFRRKDGGALLAFFASAPVFLLFFFKGFHGKVQANWAIAAFITAMPASVWAFRLLYGESKTSGKKVLIAYIPMPRLLLSALLRAAAISGVALSVIVSLLAYFPQALETMGAKRIFSRPPYNRVTGWKELGEKVSRVKEDMDRAGKTFIMSDTYQITGELAFYTEGRPVTYNADTGSRRMNQYDLWPGFDKLYGYNAIYVKGGYAEIDAVVLDAFDRCGREPFTVYGKGRELKEVTIFRCYNFKGMEKKGLSRF